MKWFVYCLLLLLALSCVFGATYRQQQTTFSGAFPVNYAAGYEGNGFSFTANSTYNLEVIRLVQYASLGSPSFTFRVQVVEVDGSGVPTGVILGTTAALNAAGYTSDGQYNFTLTSPVTLTSGQKYGLVVNKTPLGGTSTSNYIQFRYNVAGSNAYSRVPGGIWTLQDASSELTYTLFGSDLPSNATEYFESTSVVDQISPVNVNSASYVTVVNGTFNMSVGSNVISSWSVDIDNNLVTSVSCAVVVDGMSYSSEINRSFSGTFSFANLYLYTEDILLSAGEHWAALRCKRNSGVSFFTVGDSYGIIHILSNSINQNISYVSGVVSNASLSSSSFVEVSRINFTTSESVDVGLDISLVLEGSINYHYSSAGNMSFLVSVAGQNSSEFRRFGGASSVGSGAAFFAVSGLSANTTYPVVIYGKSSSSSGYARIVYSVKEFLHNEGEITFSDSSSSINTSFTALDYFLLNNTNHADSNVVVNSVGSYLSSSASTLSLKLGNTNSNSSVFNRSLSFNKVGVVALQNVFQSIGIGEHDLYLWGKVSTGSASLVSGSFMSYISDNVPFSSLKYYVYAYDYFTNNSLSNFTVYNEDGLSFTSNSSGVAVVVPSGVTDDLVIVANNYISRTVNNHNVLNNLSVRLYPQFYFNQLDFNNYVEFVGLNSTRNYTKNLTIYSEAVCESGYTATFNVFSNGVNVKNYSALCNSMLINHTSWVVVGDGLRNISVSWSANDQNFSKNVFYFDNTAPIIYQSFNTVRDFNEANATLWYVCRDGVSTNVSSNILFNGLSIYSSTYDANNTNSSFNEPTVNGLNIMYSNCTDIVGNVRYANTSSSVFSVSFNLVNERTGEQFDVSNLSSVVVYIDDNSSSLDLKFEGTNNFTFTTINSEILRFEYIYSDGFILNRYVDVSLISDDLLRVCAVADEGLEFFEQIFISSSDNTKIRLKASFADCVVLADSTRFAYQNSFSIRTYLIDTTYSLARYLNNDFVFLSAIDGGISSYINVDALIFASSAQDISLSSSYLSFRKVSNTTMYIIYNNTRSSNVDLAVNITSPSGALVYSEDDFSNNNEFTLLFDFSTLAIQSGDLFKISIVETSSDGSINVVKRYFNTDGRSGIISSSVAFVIAFMLLLFGFSFVVGSDAMSWFGIFVCFGVLGVLSLTIWTDAILFLGSVTVIVMVYIFIVTITQTNRELVQ